MSSNGSQAIQISVPCCNRMFLKVVNPLKANFKIYVLTKQAKQKQNDDEEKGTEREKEKGRERTEKLKTPSRSFSQI